MNTGFIKRSCQEGAFLNRSQQGRFPREEVWTEHVTQGEKGEKHPWVNQGDQDLEVSSKRQTTETNQMRHFRKDNPVRLRETERQEGNGGKEAKSEGG